MNKFLLLAFLSIAASHCLASPESLRSVGIETSGKDGCYLSDGNAILGATINLMVDAYDHHPKLPNQTIVAVIQTAIDAGCNINEPNVSGLTPLNTAILLNHPALVELLLKHGAKPDLKIESTNKSIHGKNSFEFYEILKTKKEMSKIGQVLATYK